MKKIVSIATVLLVALSLLSCKKDSNVTSGNVPDPAGTILVNLRNDTGRIDLGKIEEEDGRSYVSTSLYLIVDKNNNLSISGNTSTYQASCKTQSEILSLGNANGLGNLNTDKVPSVGWAESMAAVKGNLYILRFSCIWISWSSDVQHNDEYYFGLYVVDSIVGTDNGILGYTVKYCPFTPGKGWNQ